MVNNDIIVITAIFIGKTAQWMLQIAPFARLWLHIFVLRLALLCNPRIDNIYHSDIFSEETKLSYDCGTLRSKRVAVLHY